MNYIPFFVSLLSFKKKRLNSLQYQIQILASQIGHRLWASSPSFSCICIRWILIIPTSKLGCKHKISGCSGQYLVHGKCPGSVSYFLTLSTALKLKKKNSRTLFFISKVLFSYFPNQFILSSYYFSYVLDSFFMALLVLEFLFKNLSWTLT